MHDLNVPLLVPIQLYLEALEIANMRGVTLNHYVVEALLDSVTKFQHDGWVIERAHTLHERARLLGRTVPKESAAINPAIAQAAQQHAPAIPNS